MGYIRLKKIRFSSYHEFYNSKGQIVGEVQEWFSPIIQQGRIAGAKSSYSYGGEEYESIHGAAIAVQEDVMNYGIRPN